MFLRNSSKGWPLPLLYVTRSKRPISAVAMATPLQQFLSRKPLVILGSESLARRIIMDELAEELGFQYETAKASIDEAAIGSRRGDPSILVRELAAAKAAAILSDCQYRGSGYLLTFDQVVVHDGVILEKPRNAAEAERFIKNYSRSPGKTVGSVRCTSLKSGKAFDGVDIAEVHFDPIPDEVVQQLIKEGTVFQCAGGLMIEHPLVAPLIRRIDGTEDSVRGLSKRLVLDLLLQAVAEE